MNTVFITGASSGIGKATAILFQKNGWNVIATMRRPQEEKELNKMTNVAVLQCDVTDSESIQLAVQMGLNIFGGIDVLVNNAGYYLFGPVETASSEQIKRQIETNLLGTIEVTKSFLPHFRERRSGTIINLSSVAGQISIPLQSLYSAAKFGVEGFSEALRYELRPFGIRVRVIEPGVVKTDFLGRSMDETQFNNTKDYYEYSKRVFKNIVKSANKGSGPEGVAETIYKAAIDTGNRLRYPTGAMKNLGTLHRVLPLGLYSAMTIRSMEK